MNRNRTPVALDLLALLLCAGAAIGTICYNPDGSAVTNPAFQPCNQVEGTISQCCGTNWTNGIVEPDTCEPNGLCLNSYNGSPLLWRGSCTDKTWKSPDCLSNLCTNYNVNGDPTQNVAVTDCGDGTWCCQGGNTTCCQKKQGVAIAPTIGLAISISAPSNTVISTSATSTGSSTNIISISSPTTAVAVATNATSIPATTTSAGLTTGAIIGIVIGAIIGNLAVTAAIAWWTLKLRKRKSPDRAGGYQSPMHELPHQQQVPEVCGQMGPTSIQHEIEGDSPPIAELPVTPVNRWM